MLIRPRLPPSSSATPSPHLGSAALKIKVLTQVMGAGEPWGLKSQLFSYLIDGETGVLKTSLKLPCVLLSRV